jgi:hypothetical protein
VWDPSGGFFGGSRDHTLALRRVAAGTYTIEVQARDQFGWMALAIPFDLTLSATPSAAAMCTGTALTDGASVHGTTDGASDAFGLDCSGTAFASPEVVHSFDIATRRRVRLVGTPAITPPSTSAPGMQLALRTACDPDVAPAACVDTQGYTCQPSVSLERILDAGHYFVEIEPMSGTTAYDLELLTEEVGAACAGATVISASDRSWAIPPGPPITSDGTTRAAAGPRPRSSTSSTSRARAAWCSISSRARTRPCFA